MTGASKASSVPVVETVVETMCSGWAGISVVEPSALVKVRGHSPSVPGEPPSSPCPLWTVDPPAAASVCSSPPGPDAHALRNIAPTVTVSAESRSRRPITFFIFILSTPNARADYELHLI